MKARLSTYPETLQAYPGKSIDLIIEVESNSEHPIWLEAEVRAEAGLSLEQHRSIGQGRFRLGICEGRSSFSKAIKLYAAHNTSPKLYKCHVSVFAYDSMGKSAGRSDEHTLVKCTSK
ncbi:hypothetical protein JW721_04625 [Candidatus Micrarchaeota archaeon]|nr:hypothetical protein [Candidatus Micrarchaeota archaeon]